MSGFDKSFAIEGFAALPLAPGSQRILNYWFSLWQGDDLPERARFEPARVRDLLPGIMIMEVKPGVRVSVRLAGSAVNAALGIDMTGKDFLPLTTAQDRDVRLARNTAVANGSATFAVRQGKTQDGKPWKSEELQLPFADYTQDGARLILFHSTYRPAYGSKPVIDTTQGIGLAEVFTRVPLRPGD